MKLRHKYPCEMNFSGRTYRFVERRETVGPVYECDVPGDAIDVFFSHMPDITIVDEEKERNKNDIVLVGSFDRGVQVDGQSFVFSRHPSYPYGVCAMPRGIAEWLATYSGQNFWPAGESRTQPDMPVKKSSLNNGSGGTKTVHTWKMSDDQEEVIKTIQGKKPANNRSAIEVIEDMFLGDAKRQNEKIKQKLDNIEQRIIGGNNNDDDDLIDDKPIMKKKRVEKIKSVLGGIETLEVSVSETLSAIQDIVIPDEKSEIADVVEVQKKIDPGEYTYQALFDVLSTEKFAIEEYDHMILTEKQGKNRSTVTRMIKNYRDASGNTPPKSPVGRKMPWQK